MISACMKKIIITLDGYSSCGKSTLARQLAKELNYVFIDSGAMYRAITLYFLRKHIDYADTKKVIEALSEIQGDSSLFRLISWHLESICWHCTCLFNYIRKKQVKRG